MPVHATGPAIGPEAGPTVAAVGAGHVGHPGVTAEVRHAPRRQLREAAAGIDHEVTLDGAPSTTTPATSPSRSMRPST